MTQNSCSLPQACVHCGHLITPFTSPSSSLNDSNELHLEYDQGDYLTSLKKTRLRQSQVILRQLEGLGVKPELHSVLDYGCGQGWFLNTLKEQGYRDISGTDTSTLSLQYTQTSTPQTHWIDLEHHQMIPPLKNHYSMVVSLDVLEHIPSDSLLSVIKEFQSLTPQWIVIKTPDSNGLLFRLSRFLYSLGIKGPYEQLWLKNSLSPHLHYFSKSSLRTLLTKTLPTQKEQLTQNQSHYQVVAHWGDLDYEPALFCDRVDVLKKLPRFLKVLIGHVVAKITKLTRCYDSQIIILSRN